MCVFRVHMVDTDEDNYAGNQPHEVLAQNEQCKKRKYLEACLERK